MKHLETLEDRTLMAVTAGLDASGNLAITSDTAADTIVVFEQFGQAKVTVNGVVKGTYTPVSRVIIHGNAGNDVITFTGYSVGADIYGEDGTDTVNVYDYRTAPTVVTNVSCGAGADKATVFKGVGVIVHGDAGNDTLVLSAGDKCSLYGDADTDTLTVAKGVTSAKVYKGSVDKLTNSGTGTTIFAV